MFHEVFVKLDNFDKKMEVAYPRTLDTIVERIEVPHTRQFIILIAYLSYKTIFTIVQMFILGQTSLFNVFQTLYINGMFIFNFFPGISMAFLMHDRFRRFNHFMNSKVPQRDFRRAHVLAYEIFGIVDLVGQSLGLQMLITVLVFGVSGIFAIFTGFEVFVLEKVEYKTTFLLLTLYNIPDVLDVYTTCWLMSLIEVEVSGIFVRNLFIKF